MANYIQPPLYSDLQLIDRLKGLNSPKQASAVIAEYLQRGAHPAWIEAVIAKINNTVSLKPTIDIASIAKKESKRFNFPRARKPIMEGETEIHFSVIYEPNGTPIRVHEGILHAVSIKGISTMSRLLAMSPGQVGLHKELSRTLFEKLLTHPDATIRLLGELTHRLRITATALDFAKQALGVRGATTFDTGKLYPTDIVEEFTIRQIKQRGLRTVVQEILELWIDTDTNRTWFLLMMFTEMSRRKDNTPPVTMASVVKLIHQLAVQGKGLSGYAATQVLNVLPWPDPDIMVFTAKLMMIAALDAELPDPAASHTLIRWLIAASANAREGLFSIMTSPVTQGLVVTSPDHLDLPEMSVIHVKEIIAALFSEQVVDYLDEIAENKEFQNKARQAFEESGLPYFATEDKEFARLVVETPPKPHRYKVAEELDIHLSKYEADPGAAEELIENMVNLLSGELAMAVTSLRTHPVSLHRKPAEFLGNALPRISVWQHPEFGDNGAACSFSVGLPSSAELVNGTIDPQGNMTLENIAWLSPSSLLKLRAAVIQTVAALLIPQVVKALSRPRRPRPVNRKRNGGPISASRPMVETEADLTIPATASDATEEEEKLPWIDPGLAEEVFQWLLGRSPYPWYLFQRRKGKLPTGERVWYYARINSSKEELIARDISLQDVWVQSEQARSQPIGARRVGDVFIPSHMTAEARFHYERFREENPHREFDFSSFTKTYHWTKMENDVPVAKSTEVEVERTFNRGVFIKLSDALVLIDDENLKTQLLQKFRLE